MPIDPKPLLAAVLAAAHATSVSAASDPQGSRDRLPFADRRAEDLAAAPHVTPAQEGAFRAYVEASVPPERPTPPPRPDETLTTPEMLDRMAATGEARRFEMDRRVAATRALYAALDPGRPQAFDAFMRLRFSPRPHGGPPEGPPGGPPHGPSGPPSEEGL